MSHPVRSLRGVVPALVSKAVDDLLGLLLPTPCVACQSLDGPLCGRCRADLRPAPSAAPPPGVDWWVAAFAYEGPIREAIVRAKYRDQRAVLSWLARRLADLCPHDVDVVTWVPASTIRRRARGVDHAELIARHLGRRCDLPVRRLLVRSAGLPQTGRTARERRAGPKLRCEYALGPYSVLVVDDVATTGGSAMAAARALRCAGADSVGFASVARTAPHE